jgi:hypothetical protein
MGRKPNKVKARWETVAGPNAQERIVEAYRLIMRGVPEVRIPKKKKGK